MHIIRQNSDQSIQKCSGSFRSSKAKNKATTRSITLQYMPRTCAAKCQAFVAVIIHFQVLFVCHFSDTQLFHAI